MDIVFRDAYAKLLNGKLLIGNALFSRTMDISQGYPRTISMIFQGRELVQPDKETADFSFIGLMHPEKNDTQWSISDIETKEVFDSIFDSEHLEVSMKITDCWTEAQYVRIFFIYPQKPFFGIQNEITSPVKPVVFWNYRELHTEGNAVRTAQDNLESRLDSIKPLSEFQAIFSVEYFGRSDYTSSPVKQHQIGNANSVRGNILFCSDEKNAGFGWIQEAPPSEERRDFEQYDFVKRNNEWASCCWGISPAELQCNKKYTSYRNAVFFFENQLEQQKHVKQYIATRFPQNDKFIASIVNPWGCGRFPEYISPQFLNEDIAASAECGADIYQIDDSWQKGTGLADIINGRNTSLDFWKISTTRLNGSFDEQVATAKKANIELALWMAPSTNIELDDWKEFAELMLEYHRKYGFNFFKLDGLMVRSYQAEKNLEHLLQKVRAESNGDIYCNLDTTNGQRSGFLLHQEYGNIFLENRYLWFQRCAYHPEQTLSSLWNLSHFLRTERLQIEIPAPVNLDESIYSPETLPTRYPFDYWCAISLFASPLIWTAPSKITQETRAVYKQFMDLHRSIRKELFSGNIYPVGQEPNGASYCGFYADSGYILIFRELNNKDISCELPGNIPEHDYKSYKVLAGHGNIEIKEYSFTCSIPVAPGYILAKFQ